MGEFNAAIGVRLSSRNFKENEATMLLALLSFNLSSLCRLEFEESVGGCGDLVRFQLIVLKVGAEVMKHPRRLVRMAESAQSLWSRIPRRLQQRAIPENHRITATLRSGFTPPKPRFHLSGALAGSGTMVEKSAPAVAGTVP